MHTNKLNINTVTLTNFDTLPNSAHVRQPVVEALFAASPATIRRWEKLGVIPSGKKLAPRVLAWNVGELRIALATLKARV